MRRLVGGPSCASDCAPQAPRSESCDLGPTRRTAEHDHSMPLEMMSVLGSEELDTRAGFPQPPVESPHARE